MPAPTHYRVTWSGIFGSTTAPTEIWSMGLNVAPHPSIPPSAAALKTMATACATAWAQLAPGVKTAATLTRTRVARVDATGHVPRDAAGAYVQADDFTVTPGGSATLGMPLQVSLAYRLETTASGQTGRGRFYLPAPVQGTLGSDGRLSAADAAAHATRGKAFVAAVQAASLAAGQGDVVVASSGSASKGIPAQLRSVVAVAVGRALDTTRSRRGDLAEEYQRVAL